MLTNRAGSKTSVFREDGFSPRSRTIPNEPFDQDRRNGRTHRPSAGAAARARGAGEYKAPVRPRDTWGKSHSARIGKRDPAFPAHPTEHFAAASKAPERRRCVGRNAVGCAQNPSCRAVRVPYVTSNVTTYRHPSAAVCRARCWIQRAPDRGAPVRIGPEPRAYSAAISAMTSSGMSKLA